GAGGRYGRARGFFISEQIAATSARTSALSSRFEFMTTGGWQGDHLILMARHISNAHLIGGGPNHGETMLMVGVHFGG
ncbi:MAG: lipid A 3-O-deacylase, partial [Rhodanobacteraceae bacterium]